MTVKSGRPECLGKEEKKEMETLQLPEQPRSVSAGSDWKLSSLFHLSTEDFQRYVLELHSFCLCMDKNLIFVSPEDTDCYIYAAVEEIKSLKQ